MLACGERVSALGLEPSVCGAWFAVAAVGFCDAGAGEGHLLAAGGAGADPDFAHCGGVEERGKVLLLGFGWGWLGGKAGDLMSMEGS